MQGDGEERSFFAAVTKRVGKAMHTIGTRVSFVNIILDFIIMIIAGVIFFSLGKITNEFNNKCLLFSDIYVLKYTNGEYDIDLTKTRYDNESDCNYTTFVNVAVAIHSLVWIYFFSNTNNLRKPNGSIVNVLLPALVTRLVIVILVIVSSLKVAHGFTAWCDNMTSHARVYGEFTCEDMQNLPWRDSRYKFYTFSFVAYICGWILLFFLLLAWAVTLLQLYNDFSQTMELQMKMMEYGYRPLESGGFYLEESDDEDDVDGAVDPSQIEVTADFHRTDELAKGGAGQGEDFGASLETPRCSKNIFKRMLGKKSGKSKKEKKEKKEKKKKKKKNELDN